MVLGMRAFVAGSLAALLGALLAACGQAAVQPERDAPGPDAPAAGPDAPAAVPDAGFTIAPGCNPLVGDDCLTPMPSTFFEVPAATATGVRVHLPPELMPVATTGTPIRPDRLNQKDGFSASMPFLVYLAAGVRPSDLPGQDAIAASATAASHVQILEHATGARVPLFAEVDANARPGERQALLIHPMIRLKPATRYDVALVGLHDASGKLLAPAPFALLRDRRPLPAELKPLAARTDEILTVLEAAGVARADVGLAWDVVTASDGEATSHLVAMRDEALALVEAGQVRYRVTAVKETPSEAHRLREVTLAVAGPSYLLSSEPSALMSFDTAGRPKLRGTTDFPVVIEIPRCAATATKPLPFVVFGHGLFGDAAGALGSSLLIEAADRLCMVLIGTDWIGLSSADLPVIGSVVLADLNNVYLITDRLQQAHVNAQVMTRLFMRTLKDDPALAVAGHPITDGAERYYFGVSNGGVQGGTFMALSPDVERGVLNVPGCTWSFMLWRSIHFNALIPLLTLIFPDPLDRQLLTAAAQIEFDHTDPASFARHLLADPLPGVTPKRILLQESINDAQVPNLATEILARTMGLVGLELVQHVAGITEAAGPLDSAYTQWDAHASPPPPTVNTPAPADNGAHGAIQTLAPLQEQVARFFRPDGRVEPTCGGPCDFPQ